MWWKANLRVQDESSILQSVIWHAFRTASHGSLRSHCWGIEKTVLFHFMTKLYWVRYNALETYGFYDQTLFHIQSLQVLGFHTYFVDKPTMIFLYLFGLRKKIGVMEPIFLIGQVMKKSRGTANPSDTEKEIIRQLNEK